MAIDLSGISQATTAAQSLGSLILVSPQRTVGYQPQNSPSYKKDTSEPLPSLLFHYEGEQAVGLTSDVTDHYIEDNSTIQDQIALRPVTITTHGFIGELNDVAPPALVPLKIASEKLTAIGAYAPQLSVSAQLAYANAFAAYQTLASLKRSAVSTWSTISGGAGQSVINGSGITPGSAQNKQQLYFQQFYGYWTNRNLFTIQTPWAVFQDMVIMNLRAIQEADTRVISDFEITFKQLRFASTLSIRSQNLNSSNFQGRLKSQGSTVEDQGVNTLEESPISFASRIA